MPERTPNHSPDPRSDGRIRPSANPEQSTSPSRQRSLTDVRASIKSLIYKNLVASPIFPRLYADLVLHYAPNSPAAKILAPHYKKIVERTNQLMANVKSCTHIKVSGVRCGSPPLRGEQFCYFHQSMLRTVRYPASRIRHAALLEDEESIQVALMETINALLLGTIEIKRAELILRALNTAVRNARRVNFGLHSDDTVREIPDYPTPPARTSRRTIRQRTPPQRGTRRNRPRPRRDAGPIPGHPEQSKAIRIVWRRTVWGRVSDPSRRPRSIGPQRSTTEARPSQSSRTHNAQAASKCERSSRKHKDRSRDIQSPSSEGARECSPRSKPWVKVTPKENRTRKRRKKMVRTP